MGGCNFLLSMQGSVPGLRTSLLERWRRGIVALQAELFVPAKTGSKTSVCDFAKWRLLES